MVIEILTVVLLVIGLTIMLLSLVWILGLVFSTPIIMVESFTHSWLHRDKQH